MAQLDEILDRLQARLGPGSGSPEPLEGGITNRNFRVRFGERDYVLRLPGKDTELLGISREAERLANEVAARLDLAPAVAYADADCIVTEFLLARPADARSEAAAIGRALRTFHDSGIDLPTRFWVPDQLDDYAAIVHERGGALPDGYGRIQELARRIEAALPLCDPAPCHDDLLPGNLLQVGDRVMLVDWEYAGMGHRVFDLGNVAVNNDFDDSAEDRLLAAYYGEPPSSETRAALKLMRLMSDAREGSWGVIQGVISELEFDFAGYADKHFGRLAAAARDPRFEDWLRNAAAA
jgi:thiamine kinase-like enzyme